MLGDTVARVRAVYNKECEDIIYSNEYLDRIIDTIDPGEIEEQFQPDCIQNILNTFFIIHKQITSPTQISIKEQGYRSIPKLYGLMDTSNMEQAGVLRLRRQPYVDFLGQNTILAIIDTGIDYQNPLFINADNTTRIESIWDQTIQSGNPPEEFLYGTEYRREQINEALNSDDPLSIVPSTDENSHGTFLAGIAAGNIDDANQFTGVAPQARIVVVKLKPAKQYLKDFFLINGDEPCYQENDIMLAINYVLKVAVKVRLPISICLGLGTSSGDHDGHSPLSRYLDRALTISGVEISTAAGNESNTGHHFEGDLAPGANMTVELKVQPNLVGFVAELWVTPPNVIAIEVISPGGETTQRIPARAGRSESIDFILEPSIIEIDYRLSEEGTGDELIFVRFVSPVEGVWRIRIFNDEELNTKFYIWLPIRNFLSQETYFLQPSPYTTLVETGTTRSPVSVGNYNHLNNSIAIDSSRGYTASGYYKPDLVAPGVNVYGPVGRGRFDRRSGTSISAAHAAGCSALLLQLQYDQQTRINQDVADIRTLLIKGATRTPNTEYPNREWGYGALNIYKSFESLRSIFRN